MRKVLAASLVIASISGVCAKQDIQSTSAPLVRSFTLTPGYME